MFLFPLISTSIQLLPEWMDARRLLNQEHSSQSHYNTHKMMSSSHVVSIITTVSKTCSIFFSSINLVVHRGSFSHPASTGSLRYGSIGLTHQLYDGILIMHPSCLHVCLSPRDFISPQYECAVCKCRIYSGCIAVPNSASFITAASAASLCNVHKEHTTSSMAPNRQVVAFQSNPLLVWTRAAR